MIKIGDKLYHPCSVDIIESEVKVVCEDENGKHYILMAVDDVGACGRVEVIVREKEPGVYVYEDLHSECEYASGLWDFVEGEYFPDKNRALERYYEMHLENVRKELERRKRLVLECEAKVRDLEDLLEKARRELKEET